MYEGKAAGSKRWPGTPWEVGTCVFGTRRFFELALGNDNRIDHVNDAVVGCDIGRKDRSTIHLHAAHGRVDGNIAAFCRLRISLFPARLALMIFPGTTW